jgi:hypothetical protein
MASDLSLGKEIHARKYWVIFILGYTIIAFKEFDSDSARGPSSSYFRKGYRGELGVKTILASALFDSSLMIKTIHFIDATVRLSY